MKTFNIKYGCTFLLFLIPALAFSMPCPMNDQIITKSDALENVIEKCGTPAKRKDYILTTPILQEWTYYIPHSNDQNSSKFTVLIKNNTITNIALNDNNGTPLICNGQIIQVGFSSQTLLTACGNPSKQENLQTDTTPITELTYPSSPPKTLKFVNGQLAEW